MLVFRSVGRFKKVFRLAIKRGRDISKLQEVMRDLVEEKPLPARNRDMN
jgi:mRNA-degrading endonuclease YafQ of YafQ-DinJ toxin-antitoxin module